MKKKVIILAALSLFLLFSLLWVASRLTMPKYVLSSREGNLISEYYREIDAGRRHDVVFIGDCEAYSSFCPPILWEEYSITSFVRATPAQTVSQSYHILCETLKYERPRAVVFSVYSLCKEKIGEEAFNRMTIDGMRTSVYKLRAVQDSVGKDESALSYFFPVLRFHSRWSELKLEDLVYFAWRPSVSHNGYYFRGEIMLPSSMIESKGEAESCIPEENIEYLELMQDACESEGVELILVKAPISSWKYPWYDEWSRQIEEFSRERGVEYYDLTENISEIGIDEAHDSYDGGMHLNVFGAEKTTRYFGDILKNRHYISPSRVADEEAWNQKLSDFYSQRSEFDE